ncbi:MAG: 50S ribosomal protein L30 [Candidatus Bathyarchaeota archaeon]|nr:50S ribosomal protein L30 [Candidatus Bathyarchaeota archaeon]
MSEQQTQNCKCFVAVRIRGTISAQREARETLEYLNLVHTNHAVIIDNRPAYKGMLQRAQSYLTWGEATKETVAAMLKQRGKQKGGKPLTDEYAQKVGYQTLDELAQAIVDCKVDYSHLEGNQKIFRLHPPKKGYKGKTKQGFNAGGEAGYRGDAINDLVKRMV